MSFNIADYRSSNRVVFILALLYFHLLLLVQGKMFSLPSMSLSSSCSLRNLLCLQSLYISPSPDWPRAGFAPSRLGRVNRGKRSRTFARDPRVRQAALEGKPPDDGPLEICLLGLSHHNAAVDFRERLAIPEDEWNRAAENLTAHCGSVAEVAVLSTCNRFELYLAGKDRYACMREALEHLHQVSGVDKEQLKQHLFFLSGDDALAHLYRVAAGLDSLVVGEGQILAQVKRAHQRGLQQDGSTGRVLSRLLQSAITAGKRVRAETDISKGAVSVSSAATEFTNSVLRQPLTMENADIVIVGAGKMARLLLVHLKALKCKRVTVVNRGEERVRALKREFSGSMSIQHCSLDDMWPVIAQADVVYPSTSAKTPLIMQADLTEWMKTRTAGKDSLRFVDISVPRNVAEDCGEVAGVEIYNVDDLKKIVQRNSASRAREAGEAQTILDEEMEKFKRFHRSLAMANPTIVALKKFAEAFRAEHADRIVKLLKVDEKKGELVHKETGKIIKRLLHSPFRHLANSALHEDGDAITTIQKSFALPPFCDPQQIPTYLELDPH